jgi:ATP-binding cassette subfamily F protein 3
MARQTTLLKILAGRAVQKACGPGCNARIGYFSQHRADTLDPEKTVLDEVLASAPALREDVARGVLGSFMFRKDDIYKKTAILSGCEKSRLNLVKFLVDPPNLLLMDEPTTHLDIHTVESLTLALERTRRWCSTRTTCISSASRPRFCTSTGHVTPRGRLRILEKTGTADDAALRSLG